MEKIKEYIPKYILLDTIIFIIIVIVLNVILSIFNLMFRQGVCTLFRVVITLGIIIGIVQIILKKRPNLTITVIIFLILFGPIIVMIVSSNNPEYVVVRNGKMYVVYIAYNEAGYPTNALYYDYKNFLVVGKQLKMSENCGEEGFNPIGNDAEHPIEWVTYYDDDGNITDKDGNIIQKKDGTLR